MFLIVYRLHSTENNKINNLWVLCGSNERSEWPVSYRTKTNTISIPRLKNKLIFTKLIT